MNRTSRTVPIALADLCLRSLLLFACTAWVGVRAFAQEFPLPDGAWSAGNERSANYPPERQNFPDGGYKITYRNKRGEEFENEEYSRTGKMIRKTYTAFIYPDYRDALVIIESYGVTGVGSGTRTDTIYYDRNGGVIRTISTDDSDIRTITERGRTRTERRNPQTGKYEEIKASSPSANASGQPVTPPTTPPPVNAPAKEPTSGQSTSLPRTVKNANGTTTTIRSDETFGRGGTKETISDEELRLIQEVVKDSSGKERERIDYVYGDAEAYKVLRLERIKRYRADGTQESLTEKSFNTARELMGTEITRFDESGTPADKTSTIPDKEVRGRTKTRIYRYNTAKKEFELVNEITRDSESESSELTPQNPQGAMTDEVMLVSYPQVEIFGGFSYMREDSEPEGFNLNGWNSSIAYNINHVVAVRADFSGYYRSDMEGAFSTNLRKHQFLFGPQFSIRPNERVRVFIRPLFGFGHVHAEMDAAVLLSPISSSHTAFAMAFGGGMDINVSKRFIIRPFQLDYLPTHFGENWQHNFRFSTGLVLTIGGRGGAVSDDQESPEQRKFREAWRRADELRKLRDKAREQLEAAEQEGIRSMMPDGREGWEHANAELEEAKEQAARARDDSIEADAEAAALKTPDAQLKANNARLTKGRADVKLVEAIDRAEEKKIQAMDPAAREKYLKAKNELREKGEALEKASKEAEAAREKVGERDDEH